MSTVLSQVVAARAGVRGVPRSPQVRRQPVRPALSGETPRWELGTGRSSNPGWRRVSGTRSVSSALTRGREGLFCRSGSLFRSFFNSSRSAGVSCCRSSPGSLVRTADPPSLPPSREDPLPQTRSGAASQEAPISLKKQIKTPNPTKTKTPKPKQKAPQPRFAEESGDCSRFRPPPPTPPLRAPIP